MVDIHCEKIVAAKLEAYRKHLDSLKRPFLEEKLKTLKWIAKTEKKLGIPCTVEIPFDEEFIDLPTLDIFTKVKELKAKEKEKPKLPKQLTQLKS